MNRIKIKVVFAGISEKGMFLKDIENGKLYTWNTYNYLHPLFTADEKEVFEITASLKVDEILNINFLKNVRLLSK